MTNYTEEIDGPRMIPGHECIICHKKMEETVLIIQYQTLSIVYKSKMFRFFYELCMMQCKDCGAVGWDGVSKNCKTRKLDVKVEE